MTLVTGHHVKRKGFLHSDEEKYSVICVDYMNDSNVYLSYVKLKGEGIHDAKENAESFLKAVKFKKFRAYNGDSKVENFLAFVAQYNKEYSVFDNNRKDVCHYVWEAVFDEKYRD